MGCGVGPVGVAEVNKLAKRLGVVEVVVPVLPLSVLVDLLVVVVVVPVGLVWIGGASGGGGGRGGGGTGVATGGYCSTFGGFSASARKQNIICTRC